MTIEVKKQETRNTKFVSRPHTTDSSLKDDAYNSQSINGLSFNTMEMADS